MIDKCLRCNFCNLISNFTLFNAEKKHKIDLICKNGHQMFINFEKFPSCSKSLINNKKCDICLVNYDNIYYCPIFNNFYCSNCLLFNEKEHKKIKHNEILTKNFDKYCIEHNKEIIGYCINCETNICKSCLEVHNNEHKKIYINDYKLKENEFEYYENLINSNEKFIISSIKVFEEIIKKNKEDIDNIIYNFNNFIKINKLEIEFLKELVIVNKNNNINYIEINNLRKLHINKLNNFPENINSIEKYIKKNEIIYFLDTYFDDENFDKDNNLKLYFNIDIQMDNIKNIKSENFTSEPNKLIYNNIIIDNSSINFNYSNNQFVIFKTKKNINLLAYIINKNNIKQHLIGIYNLTEKIDENYIENLHKDFILEVQYFLKENEKDLIITSSKDNTINIYDLNNQISLARLCYIQSSKDFQVKKLNFILINENNSQSYVITSSYYDLFYKIYDFSENLIYSNEKNIDNQSKFKLDGCSFITYYYSKKNNKIDILFACINYIHVYDLNSGKYNRNFKNIIGDEIKNETLNILISEFSNNLALFVASKNNINIYNYYDTNLLKTLNISYNKVLIQWNKDYFITAGCEKIIYIINIKNFQIKKIIENFKIDTLQKYYDNEDKECLFLHNFNGEIKKYIINNK